MLKKISNLINLLFTHKHNIYNDVSGFVTEMIKSNIRHHNDFFISIEDLHRKLWNEFKTTLNDKELFFILKSVNYNLTNNGIMFYLDNKRCVAGLPFNYKLSKGA